RIALRLQGIRPLRRTDRGRAHPRAVQPGADPERSGPMKVLIAGAGIAGLTAALSLHARGINAQVIEGVRQLRPLGVGINLLPHAVAELAELGLSDALAATAIPTAAAVHYDRFGNEIWR